jgi:multidrug efflux pump subunit AcrB
MWIVHLALRRPYTFVCVAILMLVFGVMSIRGMAIDIFPTINIPVVSVIWNYGGLSPRDMEQRIVSTSERGYSATVNGIEHIESESLNGTALIKVYLQPTADVAAGVAQIAAVSQQVIRSMPPGITPPLIVRLFATRWRQSRGSPSRPRTVARTVSSTSTSTPRCSTPRDCRQRT